MSVLKWIRVTKTRRCPICGKPDWCGVSSDGTAAMCQRVESLKRCGDAGWLHKLSDPIPVAPRRRVRQRQQESPVRDWTALARQYEQSVGSGRLYELAARLGVSSKSLRRLRIGWDGEAWTFPMSDAYPKVVGIRRRFESGKKLSVKGGHEGLFLAVECMAAAGPVFLCEGPTDTAALLDAEVSVIGRPSCTGGVKYVVEILRDRRRNAVIVADWDGPGQAGAERLAASLSESGTRTKIIVPLRGKDARAWKPTRDELEMTARNAEWC